MEIKISANSIFMQPPHRIKKSVYVTQRAVIKKMASEMVYVKSLLSKVIKKRQSSGRTYPSRKGDGSIHIASLPGFPPNEDTGNLRRSIYIKKDYIGLSVKLGIDIKYAEYLEFGSGNIAERPYFFKTINDKYFKSAGYKKALFQITHIIKNGIEAARLKIKK